MTKKFYAHTAGLCAIILATLASPAWAQTTVSGSVTDKTSNDPLVGASITVKGKVIGTITDGRGNFSLKITQAPPLTLVVSLVGYASQEQEITSPNSPDLKIALEETTIMAQEVVVSASRVEESVLRSPVAVEKIDARAIRESPAASFYDGLVNLKGIEASTQSLTFRSINMRGFGSNGNVRVVQLIDGMDNQAPGLNFSVGNIVGMSELDVESVEILPGASSALYGPNAINGIILMNSKSPFQYQGLSAYAKVGTMQSNALSSSWHPMYDAGFRYAKAFNNQVAFKIGLSYLTALDWHGTDYRDQSAAGANLGTGTRQNNLAYNGINTYGDETTINMYSSLLGNGVPGNGTGGTSAFLGAIATTRLPFPGGPTLPQLTGQTPQQLFDRIIPRQSITRTGYAESDLVDYNTRSLKLNASLHYRVSDRSELLAQINYGTGTSVYTGVDRYSLRNFSLAQIKLELKGANYFVRAYTTQERSGDSFAGGIAGQLVNESWKPSTTWFPQYFGAYATGNQLAGGTTVGAFQTFIGAYAQALQGGASADAALQGATAFVAGNAGNFNTFARSVAENGRLLPGSPEFLAAVAATQQIAIPRGSRFTDKTNLWHLEFMYNFNQLIDPKILEIVVGANGRQYELNSEGTLFARREDGREFTINEYGGYVQLSKQIGEWLKLTGSTRYDKNQNFAGQFTPRFAAVGTIAKTHNLRASFQTGFRIPTTQDQYIDLLTPQLRLIGGLPLLQQRYGITAQNTFTLASVLAGSPRPYQYKEFKPERVVSYEVGYRGLIANRLSIDAQYYYNTYQNFNAGVVIIQNPGTAQSRLYSLPNNYEGNLNAQGWAAGVDYRFYKNFTLGGNVSFNELINGADVVRDGLQSQFNSPRYRYNLSLGNRNVFKNIGFNVAFRHQDAFLWQSGFMPPDLATAGGGLVPAYQTIDAQVSLKVPALKSILKICGSNLTNQRYVQAWGNPSVGALYFVSITFDQLMN